MRTPRAGPSDGPQGAVFYTMTGFHAFHVLTGVIMETKEPVPQGKLNLSEAALFTKSVPELLGPDLQ